MELACGGAGYLHSADLWSRPQYTGSVVHQKGNCQKEKKRIDDNGAEILLMGKR